MGEAEAVEAARCDRAVDGATPSSHPNSRRGGDSDAGGCNPPNAGASPADESNYDGQDSVLR